SELDGDGSSPPSGGSPVPPEPKPTPSGSDGEVGEETLTESNDEAVFASEKTEVPSLGELQSLLLACQTLTDLKALKKKHKQRVHEAYRELPQEQQLKVDGLSAMAVPHQVFKYTGPIIKRDGQRLPPGALVFVDPNAKVNQSTGHLPVWLLRSLEFGWNQAICVSRDCLVLVEKAFAVGTELVEGEQRTLLDFLGG
ncbi:MAG: hypothetical protein ACRDEA_12770, partial [Microcystaceae cyanobacterium]